MSESYSSSMRMLTMAAKKHHTEVSVPCSMIRVATRPAPT